MSTFASIVILILGTLVSLFAFWQLLREDYEDPKIFSLGFITLLGGVLGFLATGWIVPREWFVGVVLGLFVFGYLRARRFKMLWNEVIEAAAPAFFLFIPFLTLNFLVTKRLIGWYVVTEVFLALFALVFFFVLRRHYRRFLWYPSGRVGFAGLAAIAFYFFVRASIVMFASSMLPLLSEFSSVWLGITLALASLIILYLQSERGFKTDVRRVRKFVVRC
ncbi:hypothetical protein HY405_00575 [Candidatus Microgenomates bacterium]|nr:hypothetical protein [Candidatus Microgenomates bacterium]